MHTPGDGRRLAHDMKEHASQPSAKAARPFRFIGSLPGMGPDHRAWADRVRRLEDLGYGAGSISDHLISGWSMDVFVALTSAALVTERLRLMTLVLCNDFRHPALVARSMAALDVVSGGRAELGIGAGWIEHEYASLGIPFDPFAVRVERLSEAIDIIRGLFAPDPMRFEGKHYRIAGLVGSPRPVQDPGPPIIVGGGSPRILALAGQRADQVSILPPRGRGGVIDVRSLSREATARRAEHVEVGEREAGRTPGSVRRQLSIVAWDLVGLGGIPDVGWSTIADRSILEAGRHGNLPGVLTGPPDVAVERLERWREDFGFSEIHVGSAIDAFAPIVARLAGR